MTHEDRGHYAKKHSPERKTNPTVVEAVKTKSINGEMPCAVAHKISQELNVSPEEVGFTVDALELRLVKCQLGLYGYRPQKRIVTPAESVSKELEEAIRESMVEDRLTCEKAWEIAKRFKLPKMEISSACEALKIKISSCQLGAF